MTIRTQPETPAGGPLGDTGDGDTGVPEFEQGISNRPGDRAGDASATTDVEDGDDAIDPEEDLDDELEATEQDDTEDAGRWS